MEILVGLMRRGAQILALGAAVLAVGCGTERVTVGGTARAPVTSEADLPATAPLNTGGVRGELTEAVTGAGMKSLSDSGADHGECAVGVLVGPARGSTKLDVAQLVGRLESAGWAEGGRSQDASLPQVRLTKNGWTLRVRDYSALGEGPSGPGAMLMLAATQDTCARS